MEKKNMQHEQKKHEKSFWATSVYLRHERNKTPFQRPVFLIIESYVHKIKEKKIEKSVPCMPLYPTHKKS